MRKNFFCFSLFKGSVCVGCLFLVAVVYLHQKVLMYVEAYRLSENYRHLNELVDERDYLVYSLSQEVNLASVNQWTEANAFVVAGKERVVALNVQRTRPSHGVFSLASILNRIPGVSAVASPALAENRK
jgi:hypothetical protein